MSTRTTFVDNSGEVLSQLRKNVPNTLTALGVEAVALTVDKMESGYGKAIRKTGNLMRDVSYAVQNSGENTVDVGNTLEYGPYVHEGTHRMGGRPYLHDGIMDGKERLESVIVQELSRGFR